MPPNTQQVCDNCRLRKTRCDRQYPCSCCTKHSIICQYRRNPKRRGPKGGKGRNLDLIKRSRQGKCGRIGYHQQESPGNITAGPPGTIHAQHENANNNSQTWASQPNNPASFEENCGSHGRLTWLSLLGIPGREDLSTIITRHIHMFLDHILPVLPVVSGDSLLRDAADLSRLSTARLALLLSITAATRLQLGLDGKKPLVSTLPWLDAFDDGCPSGLQLLSATELFRQRQSLAHDMSLDAVLTSFFLFNSYENLRQDDQAWFYLNQSISMAIILGIDRDTCVTDISAADLNMRRRVFWLLFVTERSYALKKRHPILLRGTVPKPQVVDSDCPIILHDFINHIRLFESLPPELYDWRDQPEESTGKVYHGQSISERICSVKPDYSVLESQRFGTLITQQWLRVSLWRLAYGVAPKVSHQNSRMPRFSLPFEAGKSIMATLAVSGCDIKDCHGLSMENKLCEIGLSLADIATCSAYASSLEVTPGDLLHTIINTLSFIRGTRSVLLENLLSRSQGVLGWINLTRQEYLSLPAPDGVRFDQFSSDITEPNSTSIDSTEVVEELMDRFIVNPMDVLEADELTSVAWEQA